MPTPTTRLRAVLQDPGSNLNTWGANLNTQAIALLDEAVAGVEKITLTGSMTLTSANYATDQARNAALVFSGSPTGAVSVTIPAVEKTYLVANNSTVAVTLTAGGVGVTLAAGDKAAIWCDGTDCGTATVTRETVANLITAAALTPGTIPSQTGNAGKYLATNGTTASWAALPLATIARSARTSNTMIDIADRGTLIDITSGTFTQTFASAVALGSGWYCWLRNRGTGDITLDPSGAETIDALTSYVLYPGEARLVTSDGADLHTVLLTPGARAYTASGTFVVPPGISSLFIDAVGAGGGGGGGGVTGVGNTGAGAGGGQRRQIRIAAPAAGTSVAVTVGAGGAGGVSGATTGGAGGITSFGTFTSASGGSGASYGSAPTGGNGGGRPSVTDLAFGTATRNNSGGGGGGGAQGSTSITGGNAEWGGGGGAAPGGTTGGSSLYGGGGGGMGATSGAGTGTVAGVSGSYNNGGGAAGGTGTTGGAGTAGTVSADTGMGGGGGGGGGNSAGIGGVGGAGAAPGGGGGGGGFGSASGGDGGAGGRGELRVSWGI